MDILALDLLMGKLENIRDGDLATDAAPYGRKISAMTLDLNLDAPPEWGRSRINRGAVYSSCILAIAFKLTLLV